jgi:hypothetical protein
VQHDLAHIFRGTPDNGLIDAEMKDSGAKPLARLAARETAKKQGRR